MAKLEGVEKKRDFQRVDLDVLVLDIYEKLSCLAEEKGISVEIRKVEPATVYGQPDLLRVAVSHIVDNAIKYNRPGGSVILSLEREDSKAILVVEDTGIGIKKGANGSYIRATAKMP